MVKIFEALTAIFKPSVQHINSQFFLGVVSSELRRMVKQNLSLKYGCFHPTPVFLEGTRAAASCDALRRRCMLLVVLGTVGKGIPPAATARPAGCRAAAGRDARARRGWSRSRGRWSYCSTMAAHADRQP